MLNKTFSILIGIVIALTLVGVVLAGIAKVRQDNRAAAPAPVAENPVPVVEVTPPTPVPVAPTPTPATPAPKDTDTGIGIKGTVGTDVVVPAKPVIRNITVVAKNFRFEPADIKVKKGEQVKITVQTTEGLHNMFIEGYDVRSVHQGMGMTDTMEFTADKTGTFNIWCEVGSHKALGMVGKLIVE